MANRKAVKAPPAKQQDSDSDGVPDLISDSDDSSDDEPRPRRPPPATTKAPPVTPAAPVPAAAKPKPIPVPAPADEADSSDEDSVAGDGTEVDKKKKKKKPKKKKPKKKPTATDADGSSSHPSSTTPNGAVPPPVVKAPEAAPAPAKVVDPEEVKRELAKSAFLSKWQSVIAAVADIRKKLNVKNSKTASLNTIEDLGFSWAAQKFEYDVIEERTQEERRYQEACADVIAEGGGLIAEEVFDDSDLYEDDGKVQPTAEEVDAAAAEETPIDVAQVYPVELSIAVKKWLERQDERYRVMFEGRIKQLAAGQRSYALSKRLKHCSFPVYETKLDPGQRILWTQVDREDSDAAASVTTLIVWFAAKHHRVPHLLKLIEHSCGRTIKQVEGRKTGGISDSAQLSSVASRYVVTKEGMKALLHLPEDAVMLDPQGNIPLKIFPVPDLSQLSVENWRAPLRLNKLEQSVRKQQGAVLLLGRSGTGKTLCLMDRMHHDRLNLQIEYNRAIAASGGADFASTRRPSQLFVARSQQLCELVRRYQQHNANDDLAANVECLYRRMRHFLAEVEGKLITAAEAESATGEERCFYKTHRESDCVDFGRFARDIFPVISASASLSKVKISSTGSAGAAANHAPLDALVVWTQIRSFLKGSVDAVLQGGALSLESYLRFSEGRCRLQEEQRRQAYALYRLYAAYLKEKGLWDDMDRVQSVLSRAFRLARRRNSSSGSGATVSPTRDENLSELLANTSWDIYFDKVYVDEVQDYTQAEIAVFLLAVGFRTDCIFLAGDPAQSVVEGVDFRFEEVRSLVHDLSSGRAKLDKPVKLLTNYRSHSGVLSCAAAIIDKLLLMFPGSANVLSKDEGLFTGPRPNFCRVDDPMEILQVLGKGVAVLAPDSSAWLRRSATSAAQNTAAVVDSMLQTELTQLELLDVEEGAGTGIDPSTHPAGSTGSTSSPSEAGILQLGNTVMGIRAAKGLEFSDVVVLDFFSSVSKEDAKAWKVLFADSADVAVQDQQFKYPQLEPQLKMLYTAITRSMNRLLFVESAQSAAGDAFFRWLERNHLADKFDLTAARTLGEARYITSDEWKVRGIQFAGQVDPRLSKDAILANANLLDQAVRCFTNAGDVSLKATATVQKRLGAVMLSLLNTRSSAGTVGADSTEVENCRAAILAGLEKGLFEDVSLLCLNLSESLEPAHLRELFDKEICSIFKNNEADAVGF